MNDKEETRVEELIRRAIQNHTNIDIANNSYSLGLKGFDCPVCGHITLAGRWYAEDRHYPPNKPIPMYKMGYLLDMADAQVCFTCGNTFKEVREKKWVKVE